MNEYKLHQVSTKIGDSSTSQTAKKRNAFEAAAAEPWAVSNRATRCCSPWESAATRAGRRGCRRWWRKRSCWRRWPGQVGWGREISVQEKGCYRRGDSAGYPRSEDDEIAVFFLGGNGQQSGYAMCDMLCGILAQVRESQPCVKHLHHKNRQKWWQYMVRCPDTSIILLMKISYTSSWQNIPSFTGFNRFDKFAFPISQLNWCQGYTPEI